MGGRGCPSIFPDPMLLIDTIDSPDSGILFDFYSTQATHNQVICAGHGFQLSVRKVLDLSEVIHVLSKT